MGTAQQVILQWMSTRLWVAADGGSHDGALAVGPWWRRCSIQTLGGNLGIVDTPTGGHHLAIFRATQEALQRTRISLGCFPR